MAHSIVFRSVQIVPFRPRATLRPLGAVALAGFALSLLVHALSYAGVASQDSVPAVWGLHVGIFIVFIPFVLGLRRWQDGRRLQWRHLLPYFPRWVRVVVPALMAYTGVNFFAATSHLPPSGDAGSIRTREERVYAVRAFSGHWLIFYGLPALFFLYVPAGAHPPRGSGGTVDPKSARDAISRSS